MLYVLSPVVESYDICILSSDDLGRPSLHQTIEVGKGNWSCTRQDRVLGELVSAEPPLGWSMNVELHSVGYINTFELLFHILN